MTSPTPVIDPSLVARLSEEFATMGERMGALGRDLGTLREQLERQPQPHVGPPPAARPAPVPAPMPATRPATMPAPMPAPAPVAAHMPANRPLPPPPAQPLAPPQPFPAVPGSAQGRPLPTPSAPREPWWQRDGMISRVLAVAGAGVTLVGVVLLLVLAAQAGWFGPVARVVAGAGLSAALVVAGLRVHGRTGGRVGGISLAATGIAGAYLDVVAVSTVYGWVAPALGLVAALGIAGGGVALASRWRSQELALMVVVGAAVLAPFVTGELSVTLVAFLVTLQIACVPVQLAHLWPYLHVARTLPAVLAAMLAPADLLYSSPTIAERLQLLGVAVAVAVVGLVSTLVVVRRQLDDVAASAMLAVSALPLLATTLTLDTTTNTLVQGGLAAVMLCVAAILRRPGHTRIAALATGALALLLACLEGTGTKTLPIALLAVAAAFLAVSGQVRAKAPYYVGAGFAAIGAVTLVEVAPPYVLASERLAVGGLGASVVVAAVVAVAVVLLLVREAQRLRLVPPERVPTLWLSGAGACLYATTAGTVAAGTAVAGRDGFVAGHCVATIVWVAAAVAALQLGLRSTHDPHAALVAGLSLIAAALTKLFLFDLATLHGVARVSAFIVVGLLLLGAGTRYARAFAERADAAAATTPAPAPSAPPGPSAPPAPQV